MNGVVLLLALLLVGLVLLAGWVLYGREMPQVTEAEAEDFYREMRVYNERKAA